MSAYREGLAVAVGIAILLGLVYVVTKSHPTCDVKDMVGYGSNGRGVLSTTRCPLPGDK